MLSTEEAELQEIVQLVGVDALSYSDRLKLEIARTIREDYLHQNAFHDVDTYSSLNKQFLLLRLIMLFYNRSAEAIANGADFDKLVELPVRERIGRFKYYVEEKDVNEVYAAIDEEMVSCLADLTAKEVE